jgi:rubrerythrin
MKIKSLLAGASIVLGAVVALAADRALTQMIEAYKAEYQAAHRYDAFAQQAQEEGYPAVARLFRAASQAERIHRDALRTAVRTLGGNPPELASAPVKPSSTRQNLEKVIKSERGEAQKSYPRLLGLLKNKPNAAAAVRIVEYALAAEKQHCQLFEEALSDLGKNKMTTYSVCPVCSHLAIGKSEAACPGCKTDKPAVEVR